MHHFILFILFFYYEIEQHFQQNNDLLEFFILIGVCESPLERPKNHCDFKYDQNTCSYLFLMV